MYATSAGAQARFAAATFLPLIYSEQPTQSPFFQSATYAADCVVIKKLSVPRHTFVLKSWQMKESSVGSDLIKLFTGSECRLTVEFVKDISSTLV